MELTKWFSMDKLKSRKQWPANAVRGKGKVNGQPLYIARTEHQGSVLPGYAYKGRCYFVYEKQVLVRNLDECELLYGDNITFRPRSELPFSYPHTTFVQAGFSSLREPLFVGCFKIGKNYYCGQMLRNGLCAIGMDDGFVYIHDVPPYVLAFSWPSTKIHT